MRHSAAWLRVSRSARWASSSASRRASLDPPPTRDLSPNTEIPRGPRRAASAVAGQGLHVLGLVGLDQAAGDAGPVLDARARAECGQRLDALEEQISQAEGFNDACRAERARINVQRRLKDAIASIGECDAELGLYLAATVKTGTCCRYRPV